MEPHSSCWCQNSLLLGEYESTNRPRDISRYVQNISYCSTQLLYLRGKKKQATGSNEAEKEEMGHIRMSESLSACSTEHCCTHFVTRPSICIESMHACISFCQKINKTQRNFCYFNRLAIERAAENLHGITATLSKDWKELED